MENEKIKTSEIEKPEIIEEEQKVNEKVSVPFAVNKYLLSSLNSVIDKNEDLSKEIEEGEAELKKSKKRKLWGLAVLGEVLGSAVLSAGVTQVFNILTKAVNPVNSIIIFSSIIALGVGLSEGIYHTVKYFTKTKKIKKQLNNLMKQKELNKTNVESLTSMLECINNIVSTKDNDYKKFVTKDINSLITNASKLNKLCIDLIKSNYMDRFPDKLKDLVKTYDTVVIASNSVDKLVNKSNTIISKTREFLKENELPVSQSELKIDRTITENAYKLDKFMEKKLLPFIQIINSSFERFKKNYDDEELKKKTKEDQIKKEQLKNDKKEINELFNEFNIESPVK